MLKMGKPKELFAQSAMSNPRKLITESKRESIKRYFNMDDMSLDDLLSKLEEDAEARKEELKEASNRERELNAQNLLFPHYDELARWKASIKKLSASKLATYRGCPLSFNYHYLMHVKVPQSPSKVFGKEIHYMLQQFYEKKFKSADSFVNFWSFRWYETASQQSGEKIMFRNDAQKHIMCAEGKTILRNFYEHNKKLSKPIMVEEDFGGYNIELGEYDARCRGIKLIGKWDRVDEIKGDIEITDYKTDRFSPEENTFLLHRHPQFTLYALAWKIKFGDIPKLNMLHLRSGKSFETRRTEDDFEYLCDIIFKTKQRVEEGDFTPFYGFHCKLCD